MEIKIKSSQKSAFTLVELLVVLTIVAIMTAVLMVNQKTGSGPKYDVDTAAREMIALIHQQQTGATGGQQINVGGTMTTVCGVGVNWSANTVYTDYQKNNNNTGSNTDCNDTSVNYGATTTYKNVSISSPASGSVFFKLPFAGMTSDATPETIILKSTINTSVIHTICVYADSIKDSPGNLSCS